MTTTAPFTAEQYLRGLGVTDPHHNGLLRHFTDQHRAAHLGRYNIDPGDQILSTQFADKILELTTVTFCANCEENRTDYDPEEYPCRNCGVTEVVLIPNHPLPITLGPPETVTCGDCRHTFTTGHYRVERHLDTLRSVPICPTCALTPSTEAWQTVCDAAELIDKAMQQATDAKQREQIAAKLGSIAGHFAGWRWPEDQPSPQNQD